ncbi:CBO0543 family protein [Clostridium peptidivorans]|uniref:CBO0543 family protein n=1 Tax=Clostridium peptidivorans TaxID=100174 RepID=UPI000BE34BC9|nr:CBO0543 family protein [Clostridium peptidivorans]
MIEIVIQYVIIIISIIVYGLKRSKFKKYIYMKYFVIVYSSTWAWTAKMLNLWTYPARIINMPIISVAFNFFLIPVLALLWLAYSPKGLKAKAIKALKWTTPIIVLEFLMERYTNLISYRSRYNIFYSYIIWYISWFIWSGYYYWLDLQAKSEDAYIQKVVIKPAACTIKSNSKGKIKVGIISSLLGFGGGYIFRGLHSRDKI